MHEIPKHCAAVLSRAIFIGFCIQIVLGILWMCNAFADCDSVGEGIVCVGQIALIAAAVFWMWTGLAGKKAGEGYAGKIFHTLCVITFPMVMQCLLQPALRVLVTVLFLAMIGCCVRAVKRADGSVLTDKERKSLEVNAVQNGKGKVLLYFVSALACWLAAGLLRQEYLFLGLVPAVLCMLRLWKSRQGKGFHLMLLTMAAVGLISGIGSFYREPVAVINHALSRVSWTTLYESYMALPKAQRKLLNYYKVLESSYEATGIDEILMPYLGTKEEKEEIRIALRDLMAVSWRENKKKILKESTWDMLGYLLAPAVLPLQLQGRAYDSYSGGNYLQILQPLPWLGKWYMDYGCWWFVVALALRFLLWLLTERRVAGFEWMLIGASAVFMALGYTMAGAGKMDYKNTLFILCLWLGWMAAGAVRCEETGIEEKLAEEKFVEEKFVEEKLAERKFAGGGFAGETVVEVRREAGGNRDEEA